MTIDDIPFPGMPDLPTLWAVHVQGPDDIIATSDKAEAEKYAAGLNDWYEQRSKEPDFDPKTFPRVHAEVIEWPYAQAAHAESIARNEAAA
jgi:hypothetical protein